MVNTESQTPPERQKVPKVNGTILKANCEGQMEVWVMAGASTHKGVKKIIEIYCDPNPIRKEMNGYCTVYALKEEN